MTASPSTASRLLDEFAGPWRDETPVFGCCRKAVTVAIESVDLAELALSDATTRVQALRKAVDAELGDHLDAHRCCSGHLADLAFDLPDLLAPVPADAEA